MRASKLLAAGIALFATAWQARTVHADASAEELAIVARVGARTITAADVSRRIAQLPPFQLRAFGKTPGEVRRAFVEKVMVREALLAQGAVDAKLSERAEVAVVPGEAFGSPGYLRLSYALGDDDLVEGVSRLQRLFG